MDMTIFTNEELKTLFTSAKQALLKGSRAVNWSSAGTSVSKEFLTHPEKVIADAKREILFRKNVGTFPQDELPELSATAAPSRVFLTRNIA